MRLGFVGVGAMGAAMAGRALQDGLEVVVCDLNPSACEALREQGAAVATSPRELAAQVDLAAVVVLDDDQVREVVYERRWVAPAEREVLERAWREVQQKVFLSLLVLMIMLLCLNF